MSTKQPAQAPGEPEQSGTSSILSDLKGGPANDAPVMPDLGAAGGAKKSKYKVHSQTLVISLVLVASGAALYVMRRQGMGAGVNFNPPKIEYTVDNGKRMASDAQQRKVLGDLERSQSGFQTPVEKIQKNPFQLDSGSAVAHSNDMDPALAKSNALRAEQERQKQQMAVALASVEVNAIMAGSTPLARINGRVVREGDMVADLFMVKAIHDRSVDLEAADGSIHTVSMSEGAPAGGGGRPRPPVPRR
jgi:hypothetical protein